MVPSPRARAVFRRQAIKQAGYEGKVTVGLDVASSEFKVEGQDCYDLDTWAAAADKKKANKLTGKALGEMYKKLIKDFPIVTIEDPFDQDDWDGWTEFTKVSRPSAGRPGVEDSSRSRRARGESVAAARGGLRGAPPTHSSARRLRSGATPVARPWARRLSSERRATKHVCQDTLILSMALAVARAQALNASE